MSDVGTIDGIIRGPSDGGALRSKWHGNGQATYTRRLSDKILIAFHHACDQRDFEVARSLLSVLEFMTCQATTFPTGQDRRSKESLIAAHERLWLLRHPSTLDG